MLIEILKGMSVSLNDGDVVEDLMFDGEIVFATIGEKNGAVCAPTLELEINSESSLTVKGHGFEINWECIEINNNQISTIRNGKHSIYQIIDINNKKTIIANEVSIEIERVRGLEGYYLCRLIDWSKEVARVLAAQDDLNLGEMHWCIINEYRKYYDEVQCFPSNRVLNKRIVCKCQITIEDFMTLFPKGRHQVGRISGIALPTGYGYTLE